MRPIRNERRRIHGQSSVEYAVVLLAFLAILIALFAVWAAAKDGVFVRKARDASSHNYGSGLSGDFVADVTSY